MSLSDLTHWEVRSSTILNTNRLQTKDVDDFQPIKGTDESWCSMRNVSMGSVLATVNTQSGSVQIPTDILSFSALRCFASAARKGTAEALYKSIASDLLAVPGPVVLCCAGPFLDALLAVAPELHKKVNAIVDPAVTHGKYGDISVVAHWQSLPTSTGTIFLCELLTEPRSRLRHAMEHAAFTVLCPDILISHPELIPPEAWVIVRNSIYPMVVPEIEIRRELDVLLLNLPARNSFAMPLSFGYVHKELKRSAVTYQTLDAETIFYHRFHIWRLFDLGEKVVLENGRVLAEDPWGWNEECWMDPRACNSLLSLFARDLHELVTKLVSLDQKSWP